MTFADFVNHRRGTIHRILVQLTRNPEVAKDLCQNVLLKCSDYIRDVGVPPPFGFLKRVAHNEYYSLRRKRIPQDLPDGLGFDEASTEESPARICEERESATALWLAVDSLPPLDRDLVRLRYVEGWSLERIAQHKRLGLGAVKTRIHRARAALKRKLQRLNQD